jgi:hypothetical protein
MSDSDITSMESKMLVCMSYHVRMCSAVMSVSKLHVSYYPTAPERECYVFRAYVCMYVYTCLMDFDI